MSVSSHGTRSTFDRYDIAEERDLREAAGRVATAEAYFRAQSVPLR
jgi:hypothetical protein